MGGYYVDSDAVEFLGTCLRHSDKSTALSFKATNSESNESGGNVPVKQRTGNLRIVRT